jgi:hypothetical protein
VVDTIGGRRVCIRPGGRCIAAHNAKYRRHGYTCVAGRLRKYVKPTPPTPPAPPAPPAPPPPPAQPGHYKGMTSQNENFEFDVTATGTVLANLVTGQINESCTPSANLSGGNIRWTGNIAPIASDGTFKIDADLHGTIGDTTYTGHLTINGHFTGAIAAGSLLETTSFTLSGRAYSCTSNPQTWTVTRTG